MDDSRHRTHPVIHDDALLKKLGQRVREERDAPDVGEGVPVFDDAMADRLTAKLLAAPTANPAPPKSKDNVSSLVRFRWAYGPLAAAAAIAFWLGMPRGRSGEPLPPYELSVVGAKQNRSDPNAPQVDVALDPDGEFELVARPHEPPRDPVGAKAVVVRDGVARPWNPTFGFSDEGAVRVFGKARDSFPETAGSYDIVVVIARRGALPSEADVGRIALGKAQPTDGTQTLRAHVHFLTK